ncbi:hypothetical protein [Streptomyces sp. SID10815]|uniref:hypothetical protein n=1 Tax=Streptomyces sp. SID10815 TaxID=2706027 RepID=UPI0013C64A4A|nr:hypothetical protein [Streptomyces sp. SID10815]NEA46391.1 hypothetical protein [Streptomyces sp. SID10815]
MERDDGTVRFEVRGRHFKGVPDEDGNAIGEGDVRADPWIVLESVARAIAVVEEFEDGEQSFTRGPSTGMPRAPVCPAPACPPTPPWNGSVPSPPGPTSSPPPTTARTS